MSLLETIVAHKKQEVARRKRSGVLDRAADRSIPPPRDFVSALRQPGLAIIAEIKRKSPSRGSLRNHLDPAVLARSYEQHGAAAVSVLTDGAFFGGCPEDLDAVRRAVAIPALRKEFIIDAYQISESRSIGADAVLLIVRILSLNQLREYVAMANELGLSALVEVHSEEELASALDAGGQIIGINNRDLDTLDVDLGTAERLAGSVPSACVSVAESGIAGRDDAMRMASAGFDAVLVGESLLRSDDPGRALAELSGGGR